MTEVYKFPVAEAKKRVVPRWQCAGQLRRLPDPYFLNDELLVEAFFDNPGVIKRLLKSKSGRGRLLNVIENNSELFEFLLHFKRRILNQVGLVAISVLNRLLTIEPSVESDDPEYDDLSEYADDLATAEVPEESEAALSAAFPEYLRGCMEGVGISGRR